MSEEFADVVTKAIYWIVPRTKLVAREVNSFLDLFDRWQIVLFTATLCYLLYCAHEFWENELENGVLAYLKKKSFGILKRLPFVRGMIMGEINKLKRSIEEDLIKKNKGQAFMKTMPVKGIPHEKVIKMADEYLKLSEDVSWREGAMSGCVFSADDDLLRLTTDIYSRFAWSNMLHSDVFADVRKMEAEVVRWTCRLFNGDDDSCGSMSSGGTESIMLACRAYRQLAYSRGIRKPEMVCPVTAHAAFDKAADYFNIKIRHVPVDPKTKKVNNTINLNC